MSEMYLGSYALIIALSGDNANAGLPRVTQRSTIPQMSCYVHGIELQTIGPTLESLLSSTEWNRRAWTFQEALLSPRCIFLSEFGVCFECNSMACVSSQASRHAAIH